jgi:hypothetical protein
MRFFRRPADSEHEHRPELVASIEPSQGLWLAACGGTETPFKTRTGRTLLYCWQPATGRHAYLDCGTDLILSDEEAFTVLAK